MPVSDYNPGDETEVEEPVELSVGETRQERAALGEAVREFDLQAFIDGARPARREIRLYSRLDLEAEIDRLNQDAFEAFSRGQSVQVGMIRKELDRVKQAYFAQSLNFVLEQRSRAWLARTTKKLKEQGITGDRELTAHLVAQCVIEPVGVTGEDLLAIAEASPVQADNLVKAWEELQGHPAPKGLPVL